MFLKFIKNAFVLLAATSVAVQPVLAQAIVGDGGVNSPAVVQAANGVDIVQINAPNIDGVSHNTYEDFDIGPDGVILNNSNGNYVLTNLGGYIAGNPNVVGTGPAQIIINETTSSNPSQIDGYIEVGGTRADVIVANPNGINCNGCGFINTDRAVLTTGTPTYTTAGSFEGFNVEQGTIVIGQGGANASGVSQFDLIARNVTFNGTVQGQRVRVIAGRNNVIFATGDTTAMADDGSGVGEVAIDSTVFGGMYANKITIVSTNEGAGVTAPRNMAAGAGGMHISSNGRLVLGRATSQGAGNLRGKTVVVKKTVRVREALTVEARERLIVEADGIIVSDAAASVSALDGITLEDNAALYAAQSLGVLSDGDFTLNAG
ncbi:MAG: filamentous hemagglutinin N-terminal domain-containing protein, partial [Planktomarina sp.]